jgi:hypothetical protein
MALSYTVYVINAVLVYILWRQIKQIEKKRHLTVRVRYML